MHCDAVKPYVKAAAIAMRGITEHPLQASNFDADESTKHLMPAMPAYAHEGY